MLIREQKPIKQQRERETKSAKEKHHHHHSCIIIETKRARRENVFMYTREYIYIFTVIFLYIRMQRALFFKKKKPMLLPKNKPTDQRQREREMHGVQGEKSFLRKQLSIWISSTDLWNARGQRQQSMYTRGVGREELD